VTTALSPFIVSILEKTASDNGFDQQREREGDWLAFASTQCPLRVWLETFGVEVYLAAFSQRNIVRALGDYGVPMAAPLPKDAGGGRTVADVPALHRLLRRAFQLSKALPPSCSGLSSSGLPRCPERLKPSALSFSLSATIIFRAGLVDLWDGRCAATGLAVPEFLRGRATSSRGLIARPTRSASTCTTGSCSRPQLDAAFDSGFVTIADDGAVVVADPLD
jgi:hypothetical protein